MMTIMAERQLERKSDIWYTSETKKRGWTTLDAELACKNANVPMAALTEVLKMPKRNPLERMAFRVAAEAIITEEVKKAEEAEAIEEVKEEEEEGTLSLDDKDLFNKLFGF